MDTIVSMLGKSEHQCPKCSAAFRRSCKVCRTNTVLTRLRPWPYCCTRADIVTQVLANGIAPLREEDYDPWDSVIYVFVQFFWSHDDSLLWGASLPSPLPFARMNKQELWLDHVTEEFAQRLYRVPLSATLEEYDVSPTIARITETALFGQLTAHTSWNGHRIQVHLSVQPSPMWSHFREDFLHEVTSERSRVCCHVCVASPARNQGLLSCPACSATPLCEWCVNLNIALCVYCVGDCQGREANLLRLRKCWFELPERDS